MLLELQESYVKQIQLFDIIDIQTTRVTNQPSISPSITSPIVFEELAVPRTPQTPPASTPPLNRAGK